MARRMFGEDGQPQAEPLRMLDTSARIEADDRCMKRRLLACRLAALLSLPAALASAIPTARSCGVPWACVDAGAYLACSRGVSPPHESCARTECLPGTDATNPHDACPLMACMDGNCPNGDAASCPASRFPRAYLLIDPLERVIAKTTAVHVPDAPALVIEPELPPAPAYVLAARRCDPRPRPPTEPWSRRPPARAPPRTSIA